MRKIQCIRHLKSCLSGSSRLPWMQNDIHTPHGNHAPKPMKNKEEKEPKQKHYRKTANHKGRHQEKKGMEENCKNKQKTMNEMVISTYLSIIT